MRAMRLSIASSASAHTVISSASEGTVQPWFEAVVPSICRSARTTTTLLSQEIISRLLHKRLGGLLRTDGALELPQE